MSVNTSEFKEIMETTPSTIVTQLRTYISDISNAVASSPTYSVTNLDNIGVTKATPQNGILTFNFKLYGITVTIAYRSD